MGVEPPEGSIQNGRTRLILRPTGSGGVVRAEITFNGNGTAAARYLGWTPAPAEARLSDPTGAAGPVTVRLQNQSPTQGGQVVFYSAVPDTARDDLELTLPLSGAPVQFFLAGRFQRPSIADGDANVGSSTRQKIKRSAPRL
jgi:hypothetical protein